MITINTTGVSKRSLGHDTNTMLIVIIDNKVKLILDFAIHKLRHITFSAGEGCPDLMVIMVFTMIVVGDRRRWLT